MTTNTDKQRETTPYMPAGFRAVTAGLSVEGANRVLEFLVRAFDARESDVTRGKDGSIAHAEIFIGDSMLELSEGKPEWPAKPMSLHLYVPDTDAQYERAIAAGGKSVTAPRDEPYGDRAAAVLDPGGNHWFIATRLEGPAIPAGFHTLTPYVITRGADGFIEFARRTFDATLHNRHVDDSGAVVHAELSIDDSMVEVSDGSAEFPPRPCCLHVFVPDVDVVFERAVAAGAKALYPPTDRPYGDRESGVQDAGGNYWFIATATGRARR